MYYIMHCIFFHCKHRSHISVRSNIHKLLHKRDVLKQLRPFHCTYHRLKERMGNIQPLFLLVQYRHGKNPLLNYKSKPGELPLNSLRV